jgi:hypothetical protein
MSEQEKTTAYLKEFHCMIKNRTIPWERELLEKLTVAQAIKKITFFNGSRRFINILTRARHWNLF